MIGMGKKSANRIVESENLDKQEPIDKKASREQFNIRMPSKLKAQLEVLANRNLTDVSAEIIAACLERLKANKLWPSSDDKGGNCNG